MAVEHLCQLGHKRIALLNGLPDFPLSGLWAAAYRDALEVLQLTYQGRPGCRLLRKRKRPPLCGPAFCPLAPRLYCARAVRLPALCLPACGRWAAGFRRRSACWGLAAVWKRQKKKEPFYRGSPGQPLFGKSRLLYAGRTSNKIPMGRLLLRPQLILGIPPGPAPGTLRRASAAFSAFYRGTGATGFRIKLPVKKRFPGAGSLLPPSAVSGRLCRFAAGF